MQWQEVIDNPYLKNLPFKIELNRWGNIEMSPASNRHAFIQSQLAQLIRACIGKGETLTECAYKPPTACACPTWYGHRGNIWTGTIGRRRFPLRRKSAWKSFRHRIATLKCWRKSGFFSKPAQKRYGS